MAGLVVLVAALAVVLPVLAAVARNRPGLPPVPRDPWLRATARTTARWRITGVLLGLLAALAVTEHDRLGRGLLLAAPLFTLCVLTGVVVGELRVATPEGAVRSASLQVRRVRDHVPRRLGAAVLGATVLLVLVAAWTTAAGSPDDLGRAGRTLVRRCSEVVSTGVGPWPGSFYTAPLAVLVLAGLAGAALALRRIVQRPRDPADASADAELRVRSVAAVTAATGLLVGVPLGGLTVVAGHALLNVDCRPGWWTALGAASLLLAPAALALTAWCVTVLLAPGSSRASVGTVPGRR
ncbi:hypothetical protein OF117_06315 [Geodermatophilus sp. YIM 151500]|uniref:hypothetical protein n=1 Tax=Geodermatophilus sp. YIM 151500 TaxID=2984531 RepID=UPI0021E3933E|nr:hypothetical protein [Geodermatophilus sp. YIM 151500]MCV2488971.1 hypothetical protein [Geodermatophilus sp. YIM 151500]